jgi:sugar phosphate isomerase/epimerase
MRNSIATVCLSGGLREKLEAIAAAGFRGVEIFENDLLSYNGTPTDVVPCVCYNSKKCGQRWTMIRTSKR